MPPAAAREALIRQLLSGKGLTGPDDAGIARVSRADALPLSSAQERLWFLERLQPDTGAYNSPLVIRWSGPLALPTLREALSDVVGRHEVLRTVFRPGGDDLPVQVVADAVEVPWVVEDAVGLSAAEVLRRAAADAAALFDLAAGPLIRARVLRLGSQEHIAVFTMHHIVFDGWSVDVFLEELTHFYAARLAGTTATLAELAVQYADFAAWQRGRLASGALNGQLDYWRTRLADAPPVLELPTDRPRPAVQSFRGAAEPFSLPTELIAGLRELSRREGVTLFMTLLAAFDILLARYSGQRDIVVGTPIANRTRAEWEPLIGFFVNTLAIRTDLADDPSVAELLARVRDAALGAYANQDVPFERLVEELQPERDLSRSPIVQVMFTLNAGVFTPPTGAAIERIDIDTGIAKFDLSLYFRETPEGLIGGFEYRTDLFDAATIARMTQHYRTLLESMLVASAGPISELDMLPAAERARLVEDWNRTDRDWGDDACLHEVVQAQATRTPDAVAVVFGARSLTYRQLDELANRLARWLRNRQIGPGDIVGVCAERSLELLTTLLAVLKAGAAYLPLDPAYPLARTEFVVSDAAVSVVLTQQHLAHQFADAKVFCLDRDWPLLDAEEPGQAAGEAASADDLAYVIYTSGSTGIPKGVPIGHRAVVNLIRALNEQFGIRPGDRLLAVTTVSFDIAGYELFGPLVRGATVVIAERDAVSDGRALARLIEHSGATLMQATPATWRMLVAAGWPGRAGLRVVCGGEALAAELAGQLTSRVSALWNVYGPTETTIWSLSMRLDGATLADPVPIGRPLANTRVFVVDDTLHLVPTGVPGELLIGGVGLTRGYHGRPQLTAERFIEDRFGGRPGQRLYRTGDLVRYRPDGALEFLGRLDHQVKLRGFRIELGEIDSVLTRVPGITSCVTVLREDRPGEQRLVAYYTTGGAPPIPADTLRQAIRQQLPEYMTPAAFVPLERLPYTDNGKIDRKRLPVPDATGEDPDTHLSPRTDLERAIVEIFADVLQLPAEEIGIHEDFFDLGGHSLLAVAVSSRVELALGVVLSLREIFDAATAAGLAAVVAAARTDAGAAADAAVLEPVIPPRPYGTAAPMSRFQEQLWFMEQFAPSAAAYGIVTAWRWRGVLDEPSVRWALTALTMRHEALRMTFPAGADRRPAVVVADAATVALDVIDLASSPTTESTGQEPSQRAAAWVAAEAVRPFHVETGPLFRTTLLRLAEHDYVLVWGLHHIVSDGWSTEVMLGEFKALYAQAAFGTPAALPPTPVQFGDYALAQRIRLDTGALDATRAYWRSELAGVPPLDLPTDRPRPAELTFTGRSYRFRWDRGLAQGLTAVGAQQGATLYMVLMAVYQAMLSRESGQHDFAVGSPMAGRNHPGLESAVGPFVNMLPIRARLAGDPTFHDIIARVMESILNCAEHQDMPFVEMVIDQNLKRDLSRSPIFQATFSLQNFDVHATGDGPRDPRLPDLEGFQYQTTRTRFDLSFYVHPQGEDGLFNWLSYRDDLWDGPSIVDFAQRFEVLARAAAAAPQTPLSQLPVRAAQPTGPAGIRRAARRAVPWAARVASPPEDTRR